jgi:hypothetical protein
MDNTFVCPFARQEVPKDRRLNIGSLYFYGRVVAQSTYLVGHSL